MKYIKVMTIPGKAVDVEVDDDATVATCCAVAGFDTAGWKVDLNPVVPGASLETVPPSGSTVCLTRQVKGA